jgi:hypothetical protein
MLSYTGFSFNYFHTFTEHMNAGEKLCGKGHKMRFFVLVLCLGTLVMYGRAIAGLWSFIIGDPRPWMIVSGLIGGTLSGGIAILLWKNRLRELEWIREPEETTEDGEPLH